MITTTVTWDDLRSAYDTELENLRDAYAELEALAHDSYGEGAMNRPLPQDPDRLDDSQAKLWAIQRQAEQIDEAAKQIQKNREVLRFLESELGEGTFEVKMLTGEETMDIETELRMMAQRDDLNASVVQLRRNALTVDAATVDAPEGVPREDDSPKPSEAPNALTMALWEQVERFNNAGATDFRAAGLGEDRPGVSAPSAPSATPSTSDDSLPDSDPTDDE